MQKIGQSTSSANAAGEFTSGSPGAGVDATQITVAWLNSIQRELVAVVAGGGLSLDPAKDDQVLDALRVLVRQANSAYALDTGSASAYVAAFAPAISAVTDGMVLRFKAANTNTGACTFSPNGLPAAPILGGAHTALQGGEIVAAGDAWVQWNTSLGGGSWVLIHSSGGALQVPLATKSLHAMPLSQAVGRLLRRSIYRNNAGTLQVSVDGAPYVNASSTYTALNPNGRARVIGQAGGGPGGVAASTAYGQVSAGTGGGGGGWFEKMFIGGFNGLAITVGAGGVSPNTPGGSTSFGPGLTAIGGGVGGTGPTAVPSSNYVGGLAGGMGYGGDINGRGGSGFGAFYGSTILSGYGGGSLFGGGAYVVGGAPNTGSVGGDADSPGSGGSGAANGTSVPFNVLGGRGAGGLLIVEEYA